MKSGIHPEYRPVIFLDTSANHAFLTRSAIDTKGRETMKWEDGKEYPVVKIEVSSESHPYYTGKQKIVDTAGRVEKFKRRYTKKPDARRRPVGLRGHAPPPYPPALARATLALIALAFVLPGLAGHDLWKTHDAIGLGIVHDMATSGAPLVPRVAGTPWLFDPPLYHWLAAGFGSALQFVTRVPFRGAPGERRAGARRVLADLLAARDWAAAHEDRRTSAAAAMLVLLGSVGLMVHAHEALPELACLAALCGALAVLPHATRRPLPRGTAVRRRARRGLALGDLDRAGSLLAAVLARASRLRRNGARAAG